MRFPTLLITSILAVGINNLHAQEARKEYGANPIQSVGAHLIETCLLTKGIMFNVYGPDGKSIHSTDTTGTLSLRVGENTKSYSCKLQALKKRGIGAAIDLSKVEGQPLHLDVELKGIGPEPIKFQVTGQVGNVVSDSMLVSLQQTCPVSGKRLGSMGAPIKMMFDDKPLFVCCEGCTAKVSANADAYVTQTYKVKGKEIRPGVFEATLSDAKAIAAQKTCPVMDEKLGGMGTPQKVNVGGKAVYICCAGCAKKLHADPQKYLAMLSKQGVAPPTFR